MGFTGIDGADIAAEGKFGVNGSAPVAKADAYTQTYATADRIVPTATQATPPAGGTGATAGGYDTASNRDLAIASITAGAADLLALKKVVTALIDDLQAVGLVG
jgi:septal ring-binding cell division protein DamX